MSRYGYTSGLDLKAKRYRAPSPAPAFRYKVKGGKKVTDLYGELHDAWRAGAIRDFYYGARSPQDPTVVWELDGIEDEPGRIAVRLAECLHSAGIESIEVGEPWCGYPSMTVRYSDGSVLRDRYDGVRRVETLLDERLAVVADEIEKRAGGRDLFPELSVDCF